MCLISIFCNPPMNFEFQPRSLSSIFSLISARVKYSSSCSSEEKRNKTFFVCIRRKRCHNSTRAEYDHERRLKKRNSNSLSVKAKLDFFVVYIGEHCKGMTPGSAALFSRVIIPSKYRQTDVNNDYN